MDWDFLADVNNQVMKVVYGPSVTLAPGGGGSPVLFTAISFDADYEVIEMVDGNPVSTQRPMVEVRESDLDPVVPALGMFLAIKGVSYQITDIHKDGRGASRLFLAEA